MWLFAGQRVPRSIAATHVSAAQNDMGVCVLLQNCLSGRETYALVSAGDQYAFDDYDSL